MVLFILLSAGVLGQGQTYYVAQYAHGGTQFPITTTITLVNLGTGVLNPARVTIDTFNEDGNPTDLLALPFCALAIAYATTVRGTGTTRESSSL